MEAAPTARKSGAGNDFKQWLKVRSALMLRCWAAASAARSVMPRRPAPFRTATSPMSSTSGSPSRSDR